MKKYLLLFVSLSLMISCNSKTDGAAAADATDPAVPSDGSQSASQLAGSGTFCATDTSIGGTYAYVHYLSLAADGTYSYSLYFSDATSCATAQNSGGNNYATYTQSGTFVLSGAAGTPSTATKITFTVGSGVLTIRAGTYGAIAQNLAAWMNGHCTPNPSFAASADSTIAVSANNCTGSGAYTAMTIPAVTGTFSNTVYFDGSQLEAGLSAGQNLWKLGGSTFPTSYAESYLSWQ